MPVVTKFPSANQAAGGTFNGSWTNPNNAHADDGTYATAAPGKNQEFASVWSVGFTTTDIPDGSTVNSVTVEVQWKVSTTSSVATLRSTAFADSAQTTAVSAEPGLNNTAESTTDTTQTYAATPTLAQLRDLWVRAQLLRGNSNTAVTGSLDYLKVTVDYTEPPPGITSSATWTQAVASWDGQASQRLDASASFGQAAGAWDAQATQSLDATATFSQAAAGWNASATAPITTQTDFIQAAAAWDANASAGSAGITSDGAWAQAAASWQASAALRLNAAAEFAQALASWEAVAAQRLSVNASFAQAPAGWAASADAPIQSDGAWVQSPVSWSAVVDAGAASPTGPWVKEGTIHIGRPPNH